MLKRPRTLWLIGVLALAIGLFVGQRLPRGDPKAEDSTPRGKLTEAQRDISRISRFVTTRTILPELHRLVGRFGPPKHSWHAEELVIRDFFDDRKGGVFLDIGAGDSIVGSNTYTLEKELGWEGVAVDAQQRFAKGYEQHRPRTRYINAFVSDKDDDKVPFYVIENDAEASQSSGRKSLADRSTHKVDETQVATVTINTILERTGVERIDLLSMDIELWEPIALAGFDIRKYRPALVCIEAHGPVRYQIQAYMALNDYHMLGQYKAIDARNWYFAPREEIERLRDRELAQAK